VCDRCAGEQDVAVRRGRIPVAIALVAPLALVVLVAVIAPFGTPIVVLLAGFVGLVASRIVIAIVRRRRADASRVLFVDGIGEEVILQVRLESEAEKDALPYRETGRELRKDGHPVAPVGPRVRATLAFIGSTLVVAAAGVVGGFGAYPMLVLDNPGASVAVAIDGERFEIPAGGVKTIRAGWGRHRVSFDGASQTITLRWGQALLVSTSETQCYEVTPVAHSHGAWDGDRVKGPILPLREGQEAQRSPCPANEK
jgi:hypothetical protein